MKVALSQQEKVEDTGCGTGALPALQAQEQALSSGLANRVYPPMATGKQIHREHGFLTSFNKV